MKKTTNVAVNNLDESITIKDVVEGLSKHVQEIVAVKLNKTKRRGMPESLDANIELDTVESAEAVYGDGKITIKGKEYPLYYARRSMQNKEKVMMSSNKLYIKGLTKGEEEEKELTSLLGNCRITSANTERPIMFIEFDTPEEQKTALEKLSNTDICGRKVYASPAFEKVFTPRRVGGSPRRSD
ncbi:hypothetical protein evm_014205 [Chilo suppressalis]|nr:hypothetical protein evm_014205 [Chilo suppressalis]